MKKLLLLLIPLFIFFSCNKEEDVTKQTGYEFTKEKKEENLRILHSATLIDDEYLLPTIDNARVSTELYKDRYLTTPINKTITTYWELGNDLVTRFNGDTVRLRQAANLVWDKVTLLKAREGIKLARPIIFIHKTPENFLSTNIGLALLGFGEQMVVRPRFTHIRIYSNNRNIGGGAYTGQLNTDFALAAFGWGNFNIPTTTTLDYDWITYVATHEIGHLLSSKHTHWCGWVDGNSVPLGRLDSCYAGEGLCGNFYKPTRGTIMSYCHTTSQGIDFTKGFGIHPRGAIRNGVWNSTIPFDVVIPPVLPMTVDTTGLPHTRLGFKLSRDNIFNTNASRWVVAGPSSVTFNNVNRNISSITLHTGWLENGIWKFPVKSIQVIANGVIFYTITNNNKTTLTIPINANTTSLRILFRDTDFNRVREIIF